MVRLRRTVARSVVHSVGTIRLYAGGTVIDHQMPAARTPFFAFAALQPRVGGRDAAADGQG